MTRRLAILAVLILAAVLRLRGIGEQSLWFDESATGQAIRRPLPAMIGAIIDDERTPPLHYLILHFWRMAFGDSEASLRLPSALAGIAAVFVLFRLGEKLFSFWPGWIAALLLAVSRFQIDYTQEARAYSLMLFLGLLSCDIFVRLLDQPSKRRESAYVLITALLLYTHLYGVFVIVAQNLAYLAAQNRIPWRRWIMLQIASVALFSPWLPVAVRWMRSVNAGFWVPPMTLDAVPEAFWFYCGSDAAVLLLAAIAVLAFYGARKPEEHVRVGLTLSVSLMLLPVVIPVIVSMFSTPSFTYRYGIIAPAALYLLAACGIAALRFRALQVVMTIALATLLWRGDAADWRKPDWRGAANFLETNMRPGDIAAVNNRRARYLYDYYVHRRDIRRMAFDGDAVPLDLPRPQGQHVWLVLHDPSVPPRDILARGGWRVISQKAFHNVLVLELADH